MRTISFLLQNRLEVVTGSITDFAGDAIVNAANSTLLGGGGVDGAIHSVAGPELFEECRKLRNTTYPEGLPAGNAVVTGAGRLKVKAVLHTVGPIWRGGSKKEPELLSSCYAESLALARDNGFKRIAFPAISTGVYGYPKEGAAKIAFNTISGFLKKNLLPVQVVLVFFSEQDANTFLSSI